MRGGAIPMLTWATILLVLFIGNWIWDAKPVNVEEAAAAALIIYAFGAAIWAARPEAIRRGPPPPRTEDEVIPQASVAAMVIGLAAGCALFGLAWAKFLLYFGIAMFVLGLGRLIVEHRAQRATRRRVLGEEERR